MKKLKPEIKFSQIGIGAILKGNNLKVPSHQRDYSWTEKEVTKLFQDLMKAIADNDSEYFLGTIVTIPDSEGMLEVIDGQQRLATTTILLSQIRNFLRDKEPLVVDELKLFLSYNDRNQRATFPKLRLNLVDNEFFGGMLSAENPSDYPTPKLISHRLILGAFEIAAAHVINIVAGFDVKAHGDELNKWISFIEDNAEVILLKIPSGANAYKMFETLNGRGLETTQADLVKNYLFSQTGDRLSEAQNSWSQMRGVLETIQDDSDITVTFFRHALICMRGILKQDEVYEVVQNRAKGSKNAISFLKQIESLASTYVATFNRDNEKWASYPDSMRHAIHTLNFFNIHPFRPVLLAIAAKFSEAEAAKAYQMFISLGVRLIIATSTRSGSIEETLGAAANNIFTGKITTTRELKAAIESIKPSDEQFRQAFETATVSKGPFARYYLRTLEREAKKEPEPWFVVNDDKESITLEHILPAKSEGNWNQFNDDQIAAYHRRLGNMALLNKKANSDLKSAPFNIKKASYKNCPYEFTAQLAKVPDWSVDRICDRQKIMAEHALNAWPL